MQGGVVDVCAQTITDIEAKASGFGCLTKVLLFVGDVMFATSNYTRALNALDGLGKQNAGQSRIGTGFERRCQRSLVAPGRNILPEPFPVSPTFG